jgi:hypothetical protein
MKKLITNYSFNHLAKTITFNDYSSIDLERILLITNVTKNIIIYNFADPTKGGTVSGNVLTLTYDTTGMADTDKLQIFYDDLNPALEDGNLANIKTLLRAGLPSSLTALGNLKVAVEEGGAGGGLAQLQVRDSSNVWTDIGYYTGNLNLPVQIQNSLPAGTNTIGNVGVNNFPSEYPLPATQVSDLKNVNVGNFPTDYAKQSQLPSALTASGNLKTAIQEAITLTVQATDLDIRNLTKTLDEIYSVLRTDAGVAYDARQIRALTSSDVVSAVQSGTWNVGVNNFPTDYAKGSQLPAALTAGGNLKAAILEALPAGTNKIGSVDIASALPAGTNKIGSIDIASALPAGTNNIGKVDVNSLPSLPAGTNTIGNVNIASALPTGANTIGNVNAIKSGTWNVDNLLNPHPVKIGENILGFQFLATEPTALTADTANLYARVDAYKRLLANIVNFPTDYTKGSQLPAALTANGNLKTAILEALPAGTNTIGNVGVNNFPTDYAKDATVSPLKNALASVGTDKFRTSLIDALPAGTNNIGSIDVASLPSIPAGTNNIGKVDVNSLPSLPAGTNTIGNVNIASALPTGANTIGNVNAIKSGTWNVDNLLNPHPIQLTPEAKIPDANQYSGTYAPTAAGSTTIVAAITGKVIRVYDFSLWNSGTAAVTIELYFGTSGKRLFKGLLSANTGVLKSFVRPWESNAGDSLVLALSAAGTCNYCIGAVQA